jgi:large subunit ribosomal protein L29
MKAKELRELTVDEIKQHMVTSEEELFNLRMQMATQKLENPMKVRQARRNIARLKFILKQKEKKQNHDRIQK